MDVLEELHKIIDIASSDLTLSDEQLDYYFKRLLLVAHTPEGYGSLCWEAGEWLLLLSDDKYSTLFDAYGYPAISAALSGAMENGNLPSGLGWYTAGFVPSDIDGDVMLGVLSHPLVHEALKQGISSREFALNLDLLSPFDERLGKATVQFLEYLHRVGMKRNTQLMWAAKLVEHISEENPARELAIRLVLEGLTETGRYVNAFYWLKAFFAKFDDDIRDEVFEIISEIVNIIQSMGESGYDVLCRMSNDNELEKILFFSRRSQILLSFMMLWFSVTKGIPVNQRFIGRSTNLLWKDYPQLAFFVKIVADWTLEISKDDMIREKTRGALDLIFSPEEKDQTLSELRKDLERVPFFRNRPPPVEVWKECRDQVFRPLLSSLELAKGRQLVSIRERILNLDPSSLIKNTEAYKAGFGGRKLKADSQRMVTTDFQNRIDKLADVWSIFYEADKATQILSLVSKEVDMSRLSQEYDAITNRWPSLSDYLEKYFAPLVEELMAAQKKAGFNQ